MSRQERRDEDDDVIIIGESRGESVVRRRGRDVPGNSILLVLDEPEPAPVEGGNNPQFAEGGLIVDEGQVPRAVKSRVETDEPCDIPSSVGEGGVGQVLRPTKRRKEIESTSSTLDKKIKGDETRIRRVVTTKREVSEETFDGPAMGGPAMAGPVKREESKTRKDRLFKEGPQEFIVNDKVEKWKDALEGKGFSDSEIGEIIKDVKAQFASLKNKQKYKDLLQEALRRDIEVRECEDKTKGMGLFAMKTIKTANAILSVPVGGEFNPAALEKGEKNGDENNVFTCHVVGYVNGKQYKIDGTLFAPKGEIYRVNHGCPHCDIANCNFTMKQIVGQSNSAITLMCVHTNGPIEVESGGSVEILVSYNMSTKHENPEELKRANPWLQCQRCKKWA